MKKIFCLTIISTLILLFSCQSSSDLRKANLIANWLIDNIEITDGNINLENEHPDYDATIVWSTDNEKYLDIETGKISKTDESITITVFCQVTYNETTVSKSYEFVTSGLSIDDIAQKFINQFVPIIATDHPIKINYPYYGGTNISWTSSEPEYFSNNGKYTAPFYDLGVVISYTVTTTEPFMSKDYTKNFIIMGQGTIQQVETLKSWIRSNVGIPNGLEVDEILPNLCPYDQVELSWFDSSGVEISTLADVIAYYYAPVGIDLTVKANINSYQTEFTVQFKIKDGHLEDNMRVIKSIDLIKEMKVGWNLGNTFDAPSEMGWGNPKTSKAMIDTIKAAGFNVIRIPVTWEGHYSFANDYLIDESWISRYQEVVNYAIDENTFVILNMHHERWNNTTYDNLERAKLIMEKLWTQIGRRFGDYDEHLIFEGMNEPRMYDASDSIQWGGNAEAFDVINRLNEVFVKTIRSLGGNNRYRHLMITTNGAGTSSTILNNLIVPNDPYVIVSVHSYTPYAFAHDKTTVTTWSKNNTSDKSSITSVFDRLYNTYIKNDIAVIMGEFGCRDKSNLASRLAWLEFYLSYATNYNIPCVWWDTGQEKSTVNMTFSIFNRRTCTWLFPEIVDSLMTFSKNLDGDM